MMHFKQTYLWIYMYMYGYPWLWKCNVKNRSSAEEKKICYVYVADKPQTKLSVVKSNLTLGFFLGGGVLNICIKFVFVSKQLSLILDFLNNYSKMNHNNLTRKDLFIFKSRSSSATGQVTSKPRKQSGMQFLTSRLGGGTKFGWWKWQARYMYIRVPQIRRNWELSMFYYISITIINKWHVSGKLRSSSFIWAISEPAYMSHMSE